jgi:hypothetical protein
LSFPECCRSGLTGYVLLVLPFTYDAFELHSCSCAVSIVIDDR